METIIKLHIFQSNTPTFSSEKGAHRLLKGFSSVSSNSSATTSQLSSMIRHICLSYVHTLSYPSSGLCVCVFTDVNKWYPNLSEEAGDVSLWRASCLTQIVSLTFIPRLILLFLFTLLPQYVSICCHAYEKFISISITWCRFRPSELSNVYLLHIYIYNHTYIIIFRRVSEIQSAFKSLTYYISTAAVL